jgi:hypothetical protein
MSDFCEVQSYTRVTSSVFGITEVDYKELLISQKRIEKLYK